MTAVDTNDKKQLAEIISTPVVVTPRREWPAWLLVLILLTGHFCFLMTRFAPAIVNPDDNGYWAQGSLLFTRGQTWFKTESDVQFVGMHWLITDSDKYFSRYPAGLPLLTGAVHYGFGYKASILVNPILATLSLLGFFLLLRRLTSPGWALLGTLVLAMNPVFNQYAIWCYAHMAVVFCLTWGLYFLSRWPDGESAWPLFWAGIFLGAIPTIRYPEGIFALGIGTFLLWHFRSKKGVLRHYLVALLGAALPLVPLMIHNQEAFGTFYRTGYALTNEQTGFGWDYFQQHFISYLRTLHSDGVGLFFALGLFGMVAMLWQNRLRPYGVLLLLLTIPTTLLYMAYYWDMGQNNGSMRFLLPTFVCYVLGGIWWLSTLLENLSGRTRGLIVFALLLLQLAWGGFHTADEARRTLFEKETLVTVTDALEESIPSGNIILSNHQILQHLDCVRKWPLADMANLKLRQSRGGGDMFRGPDPMQAQNTDIPSPQQQAKAKLQAELFANLTPLQAEEKMIGALRQWAGERKVYFVGTETELEDLSNSSFGKEAFKIIRRVKLPEPPPQAPGRGMGGMPFGGTMPPVPPPGLGDGIPGPPPPGTDATTVPPPNNDNTFDRRSGRDPNRQARGGFSRRGGFGGGGGMGRSGIIGAKEFIIAAWEMK